MPKTIDIQGHKLIAALIGHFQKERDNEGPLLLVNSVREKTRLHTKWVTILTILIFETKYTKCIRTKIGCLESIHKRIRDMQLFEGCKTSFDTLLQSIGFKWCKVNPRRGLMELPGQLFGYVEGNIVNHNTFGSDELDKTYRGSN
ncbi:uncharacterized protein LOC143205088 [Rhynchophorus ferrugineus]|uniref:uncharacterized protein LOC143205088 n=1 Tax=Rhynchophorus ferrugineus TaxID=354439 RepID=UPI003FCC8A82